MIIIGVNKATSEVIEGDDALVNVEVLFGSLEREVSVMLSTLDDSALGIYMCKHNYIYYPLLGVCYVCCNK